MNLQTKWTPYIVCAGCVLLLVVIQVVWLAGRRSDPTGDQVPSGPPTRASSTGFPRLYEPLPRLYQQQWPYYDQSDPTRQAIQESEARILGKLQDQEYDRQREQRRRDSEEQTRRIIRGEWPY